VGSERRHIIEPATLHALFCLTLRTPLSEESARLTLRPLLGITCLAQWPKVRNGIRIALTPRYQVTATDRPMVSDLRPLSAENTPRIPVDKPWLHPLTPVTAV
jgi:hypothetical protein